ncbi:MAG TPA: hypothetical protein DCM05_09715 [Elusimicrobia bacterium]|nr:hypothetical protein [Elusimicrobiota bacterium]
MRTRGNVEMKLQALAFAALAMMAAAMPSFAAKVQSLLEQGSQALRQQQYSQAIAVFEKATRADSSSAEAFFKLGDAYYQRAFQRGTPDKADKDDAQNATEAYEAALALDPDLKAVTNPYLLHHGLALSQQALGRYDEALSNFRKATQISPRNPMPNLYAAALRWRMQDFEMSSANLEVSVQRARKARMYPALAKLVRTNALFTDLLAAPKNQVILESYDAVAAGTLDEREARARIEGASSYRDSLTNERSRRPAALEAPQVDPKVQEALDRANGQYQAQLFHEAIASYDEALDIDSRKGTLDSIQRTLVYSKMGASYRQQGLAPEAIRLLERAVEEVPQNSEAYYELALSYSVSGRLALAMSALSKAFDNAATLADQRKTLLLARTDSELEPLRDLPKFQELIKSRAKKLSARK